MRKIPARRKIKRMRSNLLPIAKEGWSYLGGAFVAMLIFTLLKFTFLEFFAFLAILFFIFVFRNPERETLLYQQGSVVSPVDGTVLSIEEIDSTESSEYAYKVEIDSNYLNVSLLRSPFGAVVQSVSLQRGARLAHAASLSNCLNENAVLLFQDRDSKNSVKIVHVLKESFKSIELDVINLGQLQQGARYGFMFNGVTTLYLPSNFRLNISVGSELRASESLLGYFTGQSNEK